MGRTSSNYIYLAAFVLLSGCSVQDIPTQPYPLGKPVEGEFSWQSPFPLLITFHFYSDSKNNRGVVYPAGRRFVRFHEVRTLGLCEGIRYFGRFEGVSEGGVALESEEIEFLGSPGADPGRLLEVVTINVGWGDAHLLILPNSEHVLIDCGSQKHSSDLRGFLDEQVFADGSDALRALVLTHPHEDHIGGALGDPGVQGDGVLDYYSVDSIVLPELNPVDFPLLKTILESESVSGTAVYYVREGENDQSNNPALGWSPEVRVQVLNSGSTAGSASINDMSLVLKISLGDVDLLFTGDAEREVELKLLSRYSGSTMLSSEVLKLSHHGSHDANSPAFLEAVSPRVAILSINSSEVGWTLPHDDVLMNLNYLGVDLFRTDAFNYPELSQGSHISILTDGNYLEVKYVGHR